MAYDPILNTEIEAGDPVTQDLWTKAQENLDDHESRIISLEGGSSVAYHPFEWHVHGPYGGWAPFTNSDSGCGIIRLTFNITVLGGRVLIHQAGSSGSTEIDILYKRGGGAWTSIFSTKPSVAFGAGDYAASSNAVISTTALLAGDLIRMDITTAQGGTPFGLNGILEFEKT
ncbi:hypothetical protein EKK58_08745 [Candidatus Dependentiae bacterium]|nr:MAG: hypothetical protein EKK58_08745 [Candidatus Dependentiae bacterium]